MYYVMFVILQESQESLFTNSMTPYTSSTSTPSHSIDVTKKVVPQRYLNNPVLGLQQQPSTPTSQPMIVDPTLQVNMGMQSPQTPLMNQMGMQSPHIQQSPQHQPMGSNMMIQQPSPLQQQPGTPGTPIQSLSAPTTPQPHLPMIPSQQLQQQSGQMQLQQPPQTMILNPQQQHAGQQQQQQLNRGYYTNNFLPQR